MQPELLRVLASKGVSDEDLRTHPPLIQTPALQVRNVLVRGWGRGVEFGPGKGVCVRPRKTKESFGGGAGTCSPQPWSQLHCTC